MSVTFVPAPKRGAGYGAARKLDAFQGAFGVAPITAAEVWPSLAFKAGSLGGAFGANARVGGGASGYGGVSGFPALYTPQLSWLEGNSHREYAVNIPLRLFSTAGEDCPPDEQVFICGGMIKWENLAAPPAGYDSGSYLTSWTGASASIIVNQGAGASVNARGFGVCRQQGTGTFGFLAVNGNIVTFTPIAHPAGDVRIPVWVEYRIFNARKGQAARLELRINNVLQFSESFTAGNSKGLFTAWDVGIPGYNGLVMTTFAEAFQRVWHGQQYWGFGPDDNATF